ncbi:MAG TPA: dihydropteroate synthase, partial [Gammaproteobacteria bacterium]|nr:dihydropteroate synthase [Gammaproteobacteria bacterium]
MGILNVTPDSFSDGGRWNALDAALEQAERMAREGADILDIGGESTRPGASPVSVEEELNRTLPVIERLAKELNTPLSVDTHKPEVMRAAVAAGAAMVNDVNALRTEGALETVADLAVPVCLMHMQGTPRTMQTNPQYEDVVGDIIGFLRERA